MLATLGAPFDERAASVAVDSAVEVGESLFVVNAVEVLLAPCSLMLGYDEPESAADASALRAPAELARALGVHVERVRLRSPHPVDALLEFACDRRAGLLVFGPDRGRMRGRTYRKAARAVRDRAPCLVWLAD